MSLLSFLKPQGPTGFGYRSTAEEVTQGIDLSGRTFLLTGCNSGLGAETLRVLCLRGATVYATARSVQKALDACRPHQPLAHGIECELSDLESVSTCTQALLSQKLKFDGIICNAGIMALPTLQQRQGVELQFFTNHIGHFKLVTDLLPLLKEDARVVVVSSEAHHAAPKGGIDFSNLSGEQGYRPWKAYGQSKFANLLFAKALARRFSGTRRSALALHPGVIPTPLGRNFAKPLQSLMSLGKPLFLKTVPEGAATQLFCATHPLATNFSGSYLKDCNLAKCREDANEADLAERLWEVSEQIVRAHAS